MVAAALLTTFLRESAWNTSHLLQKPLLLERILTDVGDLGRQWCGMMPFNHISALSAELSTAQLNPFSAFLWGVEIFMFLLRPQGQFLPPGIDAKR